MPGGGVTSEIADRGRIDPGLLIKSPALKGRALWVIYLEIVHYYTRAAFPLYNDDKKADTSDLRFPKQPFRKPVRYPLSSGHLHSRLQCASSL